MTGTSTPSLSIRALGPLIRRPGLWPTAVRHAAAMAPDGWWRRAPHLPLPSPAYLRFRLVTAYGGDGTPTGADGRDAAAVTGEDLVTYLSWCRSRPIGRPGSVTGGATRRRGSRSG